ncbi:MAG: DUF2497 domain-containing protein [Pseudomonadota bacterium]|nr:DUF2497 domain-containing protein [Pseudomonadota bacterium]
MASPAKPEPSQPAAGDPSMEDILASIRRILSEDEHARPAASEPPLPREPAGNDELVLEPSMKLPEPVPSPPEAADSVTPPPHEAATPEPDPVPPASSLVAPEAARAAASSVAGLIRALSSDRTLQVHAGGPTLEDIVRAELRPLLKEWLDVNLPPLVERLVRAEIERVVGRAVP